MLGKKVEVVIEGSAYGNNAKFCAPLYCARVIDENSSLYNKNVYVIANNSIDKYFKGTVIAIANKGKGRGEKIVLAPPGSIYYSPEIRSRLSRVRNQGTYKLSCLYEKSCGAVIFCNKNNKRYFLIVKNKNGKHWGFPKGHIEVGETEEQTAIREIKEETNLDVSIIKGFRKTSIYRPFGHVKKMVVIFLAQANSMNVRIQCSEIESYRWMQYDDIVEVLKYRNDLKTFESAINWFNQLEKK